MKHFNHLGVYAVLLVVALLGASCGPASTPTPAPAATLPTKSAVVPSASPSPLSSPKQPVILRVGMGSISEKLDPHTIWSPPGPTAFAPIYDALAWMDAEGKIQPALALSWNMIDNNTWEFKLRQGVKFQNGQEFTSDDVKATFERLFDKDKVAKYQLIARGQVDKVSAVEVVDKYTVRLKTSTPDPILPRSLPIAFILPGDYYRQVGDEGIATKPIGTGPFKLKEFVKGDHITYEAWDGSWRGKPKVDVLMQISMPESASRIAALQSGGIDIVHFLPPDQATALQKAGFKIVNGPVAGQYLCDVWDVTGPMADRRVREALNYAVDKEAVIKNVMNGYGAVVQRQPLTRGTLGYDPNLKAYPYDPAKAKQLLAEAGYPNGFEVRFQHSIGFILNDGLLAQAIQGYLADVGVKAKLEGLEYAVFRDWHLRNDHSPLWCWKNNNYPQMDGASLHYTRFVPGQLVHPFPGGKTIKDSGWVNEKYIALVREAVSTFDEGKRAELIKQATAAMNADLLHLYMIEYDNLFATAKNVEGLVPRFDENIWFDTITK
jgi:peptide/nickel transport system substrate-binding protein